MPNSAYNDFMQDPDQASRRQELSNFCGPNSEKFLKIYDSMARVANPVPGTKPQFKFFDGGFCWPALFLGPIWMMYRKMWVWGGALLLASFLLRFVPLPRGIGIGITVGIAVAAARLYVFHAITTIVKLRNNPPALAAASGVSPLAGWTTGILYLVVTGYIVLQAFNAQRTETLGGPTGTYSSPESPAVR